MPSSSPSVALLTIATGKYFHTFIPNLLPSITANFLPHHPTHTFILTDQPEDALPPQHSALNPQHSVLPIPHHPWPYSTLLRFHHLLHHAQAFAPFDYLFYIDADMLVTDTILADDILTPDGLSATEHPGYWPNKRGTFERNPASTAHLPKSHQGPYYQGCFFGGPAPLFLLMASTLRDHIDQDLAHTPPLIAEWWDESHLNWFLAHYPPAKSLPPSYAYVDAYNLPVPRKIVHLPKNHEAMRAG